MSLYRIEKAQKKPLNKEAPFESLFPVGITPKASDILVGGGPNDLIISDFKVETINTKQPYGTWTKDVLYCLRLSFNPQMMSPLLGTEA